MWHKWLIRFLLLWLLAGPDLASAQQQQRQLQRVPGQRRQRFNAAGQKVVRQLKPRTRGYGYKKPTDGGTTNIYPPTTTSGYTYTEPPTTTPGYVYTTPKPIVVESETENDSDYINPNATPPTERPDRDFQLATVEAIAAADEPWDIRDSVPGEPGRDYPAYGKIPKTSFTCDEKTSGYYADVETRCQVFHRCSSCEGALHQQMDSYLCPNGSIFNQQVYTCDWWGNVDCPDSGKYFTLNEAIYAQDNLGEYVKFPAMRVPPAILRVAPTIIPKELRGPLDPKYRSSGHDHGQAATNEAPVQGPIVNDRGSPSFTGIQTSPDTVTPFEGTPTGFNLDEGTAQAFSLPADYEERDNTNLVPQTQASRLQSPEEENNPDFVDGDDDAGDDEEMPTPSTTKKPKSKKSKSKKSKKSKKTSTTTTTEAPVSSEEANDEAENEGSDTKTAGLIVNRPPRGEDDDDVEGDKPVMELAPPNKEMKTESGDKGTATTKTPKMMADGEEYLPPTNEVPTPKPSYGPPKDSEYLPPKEDNSYLPPKKDSEYLPPKPVPSYGPPATEDGVPPKKLTEYLPPMKEALKQEIEYLPPKNEFTPKENEYLPPKNNGGYPGSQGGYSNQGGYFNNNNGYSGTGFSNGGYSNGGYEGNQGGYNNNNNVQSFSVTQGGFFTGPQGYSGQGGYSGNQGGYSGNQFSSNQGGYTNNQGGYINTQGYPNPPQFANQGYSSGGFVQNNNNEYLPPPQNQGYSNQQGNNNNEYLPPPQNNQGYSNQGNNNNNLPPAPNSQNEYLPPKKEFSSQNNEYLPPNKPFNSGGYNNPPPQQTNSFFSQPTEDTYGPPVDNFYRQPSNGYGAPQQTFSSNYEAPKTNHPSRFEIVPAPLTLYQDQSYSNVYKVTPPPVLQSAPLFLI